MFDEIFKGKKCCPAKLTAYGFTVVGEEYRYGCDILGGTFRLMITLDRLGHADTSLTEPDTGEEYVLYKTTAQGHFVGQVREAIDAVLRDVADACFDASPFRKPQTLTLLAHVREVYGDAPEFLWERTPGNGILRRRDSGKWYAALLTIPQSKLGLSDNRVVEIVNLHGTPDQVAELLQKPHFYPGWHMNKKSWFSVILDGSVTTDELFALLVESYRLAKK